MALAAPIDSPAASRAGAGRPLSAGATSFAYSEFTKEPTTATPRAPDTIRATVFMAEATPDLAAGTALTTASVAGAITQPIERARKNTHASSAYTLVSASHRSVVAITIARPVRPAATTGAIPIRSTARPDEPAPMIRPSASGAMTAPASIAE